MLQWISDATNIGIYHAVATKISKQKRIATLAIYDNNNNSNNKNKSNNFNINSIDFTKIGHHLFLHSKSVPATKEVLNGKNNVDICGLIPQEKFTCHRKLYSQINYPYFKNKKVTFLISEPKQD